MTLLTTIRSPQDLKRLADTDLKTLCEEIRHYIVDVMALNGGHLGSNMGIVELTVALHKVFNSPTDQLIFDVSHQTYPHKLLTGRQKEFPTIRQFLGLSGFSHPEESTHDHFFAGHAGTALSLALGVAKGRDLNNDSFHVLPIIGDATLTCGLALEALNNIPEDLSRFVIILNDNNMSISHNVGAIPRILQNGCASFFAHYGLTYTGPIDGHNVEELIKVLTQVKNHSKPVLLHVKTIKGKGLKLAESDPIPWHGCSPFDKVTGEKSKEKEVKKKFPKIFGEHLQKMATSDPSIVTVTPAMPLGSCITSLMDQFPTRSIDVGIAEGHAVTYSGGIGSLPDKKVVCSIYATFLQRAFDNLFQDVCLQNIPVVFGLDRSGIATGDGATHHGIYDIAFLNAMPNMVICQPRDGHVLKELMESAFDWQKPTAIRYPNMGTDTPSLPIKKRFLGKGDILKQGSQIALVALGHMCTIAFEVGHLLKAEGFDVTIVDPVFVKPLDAELFEHLFLTHRFVATIEEHAINSGLGVIINTFAIRQGFGNVKVQNFGIPDTFIHQGSHRDILAQIGLDAETIAQTILQEQLLYDHCHLSS